MKNDLFIEFHAWTTGSPMHPDGVVDVTKYVEAVRWTASITPPWGGLTLQLAIPYRNIRDIFPGRRVAVQQSTEGSATTDSTTTRFSALSHGQVPETGFWITVGHESEGRRRTFGMWRCSSIQFGLQSQGPHIVTQSIHLEAENFLAFLGSSRLQISPAGAPDSAFVDAGFVYNLADWQGPMVSILNKTLAELPGYTLERIWTEVVKVVLPPSLHGGAMLGPFVSVVRNEPSAQQWAPLRAGQCTPVSGLSLPSAPVPQNKTLLSFIMEMFGADPRLVEFFPSYEYSMGKESGQDAQPCLIYRMRPWLTRKLDRAAVGADGDLTPSGPTAYEKSSMAAAAPAKTTYTEVDWYEFKREAVQSVQLGWTDGDRVNLVFGGHFAPDGGSNTYGLTGTPLVRDKEQMHRHGLRPTTVQWPFFPQEFTEGIPDYNNAIIELGWAMCAESERFCRGVVQTYYRPWVTQGHWATIWLADSVLTAYIESVVHDVYVQGQQVLSSTTISFSRGTLSYKDGVNQDGPDLHQMPAMTAEINDQGNKTRPAFVPPSEDKRLYGAAGIAPSVVNNMISKNAGATAWDTLGNQKLRPYELAQLCYYTARGTGDVDAVNGWTDMTDSGDLVKAVRIILGESGGNQKRIGPNANKSLDRGIFQLNSVFQAECPDADAYVASSNAAYTFKKYTKGDLSFTPGHFHTLNITTAGAAGLLKADKDYLTALATLDSTKIAKAKAKVDAAKKRADDWAASDKLWWAQARAAVKQLKAAKEAGQL